MHCIRDNKCTDACNYYAGRPNGIALHPVAIQAEKPLPYQKVIDI